MGKAEALTGAVFATAGILGRDGIEGAPAGFAFGAPAPFAKVESMTGRATTDRKTLGCLQCLLESNQEAST